MTWNGLALLQPCLRSLRKQTVEHELVVVDNGSTDGTVAWARSTLLEAKIVALPRNVGFAAGNNAGFEVASGELIVLVNNDTIAPPDFLAELARPLHSDASLAASAGVLTFAHQPEVVASAGIVVGRDGVHRDARMLQSVEQLPLAPTAIFGASGGAACYRRSALEDVGLFEERFFMYLEDADLAWRLRLRGWHSILAPAARIKHVYSASSGQGSPLKQRLLALNRWRVLVRCFPAALWQQCAAAILRYDLAAIMVALAGGRREIVQGRLAVLRELPQLLRERRAIGNRRTVKPEMLVGWLEAAPSPWQIRRQMRDLEHVLRERR